MSSKMNIVASVVVAALVSVVAWFALPSPVVPAVPSQVQVEQVGQGATETNITQFVKGVGVGDVVEINKVLVIGSGANSVAFRNVTGKVMYVDKAIARTSATATSTRYRVIVATSTASTISDYTIPFNGLLDFTMASSSVATTTTSVAGAGENLGVVRVADGEYVILKLYNAVGSTNVPVATCNGVNCETATSTARGFNVSAFIHGFYQP